MPEVRPFKAVRYNKKKIGRLSSVVAPPYDIIPQDLQDKLYGKSPYNFVRLELNKISPGDNERDNRYTRSKDLFERWTGTGVMARDQKDALYIYSQEYTVGNKKMEQLGFIGLMGLGAGGSEKVLPHENTLSSPKEDRMNLIRLVKSNLSPIFVLYESKDHRITSLLRKISSKEKPLSDVVFEGIRHRIWKIEDVSVIDKIGGDMRNKDIFIADGHHRYEVSRMYNKEASQSSLPEGVKRGSGFIMTYFVEMDDRMLTVLPAHRLIKDARGMKKDEVIDRLGKYFDISEVKNLKSLLDKLSRLKKYHAYGLYLGRGAFYALRLKNEKDSDRTIADKPAEWKRLDVSILHLFVFKRVLALSDSDDNVEFVKSAADAVRYVDSGKFKIAFFLNPTKVSEVKKIARLGERMPRKATYFYPKQLSGLVVNKF